jgi:zinc protease
MKDAAYRPSTLPDIQASLGTYYSNFDTTSGGVITRRAERVLAAANSRVGAPEPDEAYARSFGELSRWLAPQFAHGAIELSIVGDTNWSEASDAVSRTLGALPAREPYPKPGKEADIRFATPSKFPQLFSLDSRASQTAIAWYWPVPDIAGAHDDRRCRLLAAVLNELLFTRLREELGVSYTPGAEFVRYDGWPTFSYFTLRADVACAQGPKAAQVMRGEIERLLTNGIDEDVFLRADHPFIRSREEDLRSNSYWGGTVLSDAQLRPERLLAARDRAADTAAITRNDLEGLARRYLAPARGFLFIAEPGPTANWAGKYYWDAK